MTHVAQQTMSTFETDVDAGTRFKFGENWHAFLRALTPERIRIAETSLREMLGVEHLRGRTFLDVGSGSGLSSLAARNLGATVYSFDFDPSSVACTRELRRRYHPDDASWQIREGSALDTALLASLGQYDVVYSWGVLHHTGYMWDALHNMVGLVKPGGILFLALYNDQGRTSRLWRAVKRWYCAGGVERAVVLSLFLPYFCARVVLDSVLARENLFATYQKHHGMSIMHDWIDWLGGYPFEVARVDDIFHFYQRKGFTLTTLRTTSDWGINQFVLVKR